jgi:hypothetical protein
MRERGLYQIQLMKTRSSSGVGQKIELAFDVETLRITDPGEGVSKPVSTGSEILSQIKSTSQITGSSNVVEDTPKTAANVDSAKLKSILKNLGR